MANEKISELPDGAPAQPTDAIVVARGGANFSLGVSDVNALGIGIGVGITGNTAGVPNTVSSGTLVLGGGNNITLSQNGQSISIIGGAGGNFSAGVSNIGNTLGNTGVTGTQLVLAGGNNVTLSQFTSPSGATVTFSAANQSVQTQNAINASMGGNTSGALALVSSGTLFLAGGNNVTLSQNGNSVTISANTAAAANLSVSAGTTSGAFGGITLANSNSITFGLNNGTITASFSQSVQTQASGNIGATGFATTTIAGTAVAGTNNTAGFTLAVPPFITVQTAQTQNVIDVSLSGNTSGALALISSGTMVLAGGNNVTLSQNAQSVTISAAAQTNQSMGIYASSNTTGQSSFSTVDARSFTHVGAGNVSVGMSNGSLVISGATAIPPSTAGINAAGNTTGQSFFSTYQQSSAIFSGGGIISVGWSSNSFIISAPASTGISQSMFAVSNTTLGTSGTQSIGSLVLAGAGNVSVGVSNGSYVISGSGGGGGGGVNFGVSTAGNTAGATGTVSTGNVVLVGSGPISLSQATGAAGSAATITINAPATSSIVGTGQLSVSVNASTISLGVPTQTAFLTGNTTQGSSGTFTAGSLLINALGGLSAGYSNGSLVLSGGAGGGGGNFTAGVSGGNTSNTSGTVSNAFVLAGGNNITLSASTGAGGMSVTISAFSQTVQTQASGNIGATGFVTTTSAGSVIAGTHNTAGFTLGVPPFITTQSNQNLSLFALGNTTQNSSTVLGAAALSLNALGAMTAGYSNGSIQLSAPATSSISGTGGISASVNGSTIFIGQAPISRSFWPEGNITAISAPGQGSVSIQYVPIDGALSASRLDALVAWSGGSSASAVTGAIVVSAWAGISTRNGSTLSSLSSGSTQTTYTYASNTAGATAFTANQLRPVSVPMNMSFTQGEYFVGFNFSTNSSSVGAATTNFGQTLSVYGGNQIATSLNYAEITAATATSTNVFGGMGIFTAQTGGMPVSIGLSAINQTGAALSQANIALVFRNV
jgi:hypothetical protein